MKTADAAVGCQDPQNGQKYILMINQAICINILENHLLCPMQCHLNGIHISGVTKFLPESLSLTTHAIQGTDPLHTAFPFITQHHLSRVTSYFDVCSPIIAEYENEQIPKTPLATEEPPWDPSTKEYSQCETCMYDH